MDVAEQELAAPDGGVVSVARAVEGHADDRFEVVVLRHAAEGVGVVVLDLEHRDSHLFAKLLRHFGGVVQGVLVTDDDVGLHFQQLAHPVHGFLQRFDRPQVCHVPDVGARVEEFVFGDAKRVFEFAADAENSAGVLCFGPRFHPERQRRVAAGAADHVWFARVPGDDGVVGTEADLPVVGKDEVAEGCQDLEGFLVRPADGRAPGVAARHDEAVRERPVIRVFGVAEQQILHRVVGQHDAHVRVVGGDGRTQLRVVSRVLLEEQDRLLRPGQEFLLAVEDDAFPLHDADVFHHDREGLERPVLEFPQPGDGRFVRGVAAQVEPADALDGDDAAVPDDAPRLEQGAVAAKRPAVPVVREVQLRSAVVAADGLGVVPPGLRARVLRLTVRAHRELRHGGPHPVVGHGV